MPVKVDGNSNFEMAIHRQIGPWRIQNLIFSFESHEQAWLINEDEIHVFIIQSRATPMTTKVRTDPGQCHEHQPWS